MIAKTWEHYWILKERCSKGSHKFRDNDFGTTFCLVCGQMSLNPCGVNLLKEEIIVTNKLK